MAAGCHRLLKPSTLASIGMTSTIMASRRQRQSGAPGVASPPEPRAQLTFGDLSLARAAIAQRIDERE
jgi:hypothetical protein